MPLHIRVVTNVLQVDMPGTVEGQCVIGSGKTACIKATRVAVGKTGPVTVVPGMALPARVRVRSWHVGMFQDREKGMVLSGVLAARDDLVACGGEGRADRHADRADPDDHYCSLATGMRAFFRTVNAASGPAATS